MQLIDQASEVTRMPDRAGDEAAGVVGRLIDALEVAHHVPGRLRVRLVARPSALPPGDASRALDRFRRLPGITSVEVSAWARSCLVRYDAAVISPTSLRDLFAGTPGADVSRLVRLLEGAAGGGERDGEGCE